MYQCFHCGHMGVIWDADFDSEDYGYAEEGLIHECHCTHCGAKITYFVPLNNEENAEDEV